MRPRLFCATANPALAVPLDRTTIALLDAEPVLITEAQPGLCLDMALPGCRFVEFGGQFGVLLQALSTLAEDTRQAKHRLAVPPVGRLPVPFRRFDLIDGGTGTVFIGEGDR